MSQRGADQVYAGVPVEPFHEDVRSRWGSVV
jgi:hypothetical protein